MKLLWEYPLPMSAEPRDYDYEGPILAHGGTVYHAGRPDPETIADRGTWYLARLHRIGRESGIGEWTDFEVPSTPSYGLLQAAGSDEWVEHVTQSMSLPGRWCLSAAGERVWFQCSATIAATGEPRRLDALPDGLVAAEKARAAPLQVGSRLLYTNSTQELLCSFDPAEERLAWSQTLKCEKPYSCGCPLPFGEQIACYGRDSLLFFDRESGAVVDEIRIPRVDKLYSPIADGDDLLLGYTNWTSAGVIRYHRPTRKIVWQYRRKFQGPNTYCRIWRVGDVIVWVKGETELIGLDAATGEERWRMWTSPYLYTRLTVLGTDLLFGTAGRSGAVQLVDGLTGETRWSQWLNNGCSYYALDETTVFVGDFDGFVRRFDVKTGAELDRFHLGTQVVGDIALDGDRVYTVAWPDEDRPPRIVCIGLESTTTF